ncbi:protein NRT1/ PTR FAMILY 1.2-like isoform X1 [Ziziphus jujuba]|uniref:Protein NRT1/ PTR FAMILY 1.2-like isoform X1 n=1 Tax=Ziziphus jujuba TaxID=326968 RepID=A0A6P6G972_ZIZJJ|nr:protein NRT1/ PTR FAMILY 1.2-like isoform X1 [Ziziphus jujuba]
MANPSIEEDEEAMEKPLLSSSDTEPPNSKGGIRTLPFILANEAFERLANYGLQPNMVLYLTREYGLRAATAANVQFLWSAATDFTPIVGAFLADSYVGRYPMIGFGCILCLLGTVLLWLTTIIPQARPFCDQFSFRCTNPAASQLLILYSSFGLLSIGAGGIRSSSLAFGVNQMDTTKNPQGDTKRLSSFISLYSVVVNISIFISFSCIAYIQEHMGWNVGFGVPALLMLLSVISFFLASPFYIKLKPETSILTGLAQVVVASYRNRDIQLSSSDTIEYYHTKGSIPAPSEKLRFLNKACIIRNDQQSLTLNGIVVSDPWSLCTVNQVEDLKALIWIIPIWTTGVFMFLTTSQSSFPVIQATSMDRHITSSFEIPAGSFGMFVVVSMSLWLCLYDRIILPLASKIKGQSVSLSSKNRMGIGIFLGCISMSASAIVESVRRKRAIQQGFSDDPHALVNMSASWLIPQNIFLGVAQAFNAIGQIEFYYSELPKSMSSIALSLNLLGSSIANLIASLIISIVDDITKRGGHESWVSDNMNQGHYDYYCWLLAGLGVVNFVYYIACSKAYGPCKNQGITI